MENDQGVFDRCAFGGYFAADYRAALLALQEASKQAASKGPITEPVQRDSPQWLTASTLLMDQVRANEPALDYGSERQ